MLRVVGHAGVGLLAVLCAALSAASYGPSAVETGQASDGDFYKGKPVSIIVGSGAGGGGLVAANDIFSAAAKDGTVVGLFHEMQMMNQLTGGEGVNVDLREFDWLGSSYDDPNVCIVRTESPVTTFEDMVGREMPIAIGGTGPGSNTYDAPRVLAAATGVNLRAVAGYPTTNDVRIGVERGEIQGMCLGWESVQSASGP